MQLNFCHELDRLPQDAPAHLMETQVIRDLRVRLGLWHIPISLKLYIFDPIEQVQSSIEEQLSTSEGCTRGIVISQHQLTIVPSAQGPCNLLTRSDGVT